MAANTAPACLKCSIRRRGCDPTPVPPTHLLNHVTTLAAVKRLQLVPLSFNQFSRPPAACKTNRPEAAHRKAPTLDKLLHAVLLRCSQATRSTCAAAWPTYRTTASAWSSTRAPAGTRASPPPSAGAARPSSSPAGPSRISASSRTAPSPPYRAPYRAPAPGRCYDFFTLRKVKQRQIATDCWCENVLYHKKHMI